MNTSQPLVSVIIPSYNHAHFVEACLQSVLKQSYRDFELIILDDGSPDDSKSVIEGFLEKLSSCRQRIHFDSHSNIGLCATLNKGLSLAQGKYVVIFASDDIMMLDRLEKQVAYLEKNSEVAVCGGSMLGIDNDGVLLSKQKILPACRLDFDDVFWRGSGGLPAPTAMIRKSVIDEVGGYDPAIAIEDLYMWLKITAHGHKMSITSDVVAYYRSHDANMHGNYQWMIDNIRKIYLDYQSHPKYAEVLDDFLTSMLVKTAKQHKNIARDLLKDLDWSRLRGKKIKGLLRLVLSR